MSCVAKSRGYAEMHNWISPQNVYVRLDYFKPAGIDRGACILRAPMMLGAAQDFFVGEVDLRLLRNGFRHIPLPATE